MCRVSSRLVSKPLARPGPLLQTVDIQGTARKGSASEMTARRPSCLHKVPVRDILFPCYRPFVSRHVLPTRTVHYSAKILAVPSDSTLGRTCTCSTPRPQVRVQSASYLRTQICLVQLCSLFRRVERLQHRKLVHAIDDSVVLEYISVILLATPEIVHEDGAGGSQER